MDKNRIIKELQRIFSRSDEYPLLLRGTNGLSIEYVLKIEPCGETDKEMLAEMYKGATGKKLDF
jgi:hypothetical protein